jgi:hypothetical protein
VGGAWGKSEAASGATDTNPGSRPYVECQSLARFCCELLNLHRLAESAEDEAVTLFEARMRKTESTIRLFFTLNLVSWLLGIQYLPQLLGEL